MFNWFVNILNVWYEFDLDSDAGISLSFVARMAHGLDLSDRNFKLRQYCLCPHNTLC